MITAAQLRAARGLLDWTRNDLAQAASVSPETIKNIEHGTFRPQETTADAIVKAFSAHDVAFTEDEGVKKSLTLMTSYKGKSEFRKYVDDFYTALLKMEGKEALVCAAGIDDRRFSDALGDYVNVHAERMSKLKNLHFKSLVSDKSGALFPAYIEYRVLPNMPMTVLFGIYGNFFDLTIYGEGPEFPKVVVIKSQIVVDAYRSQFDAMWNNAKPVDR